ncbi:hypothetical protein QQF64_024935 [Cirrhinus molitorella]|uniref:Uncharacterized protein n=1 Tax=Cirrhinus molitorella TaxID=172907 RepID=A0ABR3NNE4_9TELE
MDYQARPAARHSVRMRRPPARFADCMVREHAPLPPPSLPILVVSDHRQTDNGNPCSLGSATFSSAQGEQSHDDLLDMDVKQEILGLKSMLGEIMARMSRLAVSSKQSDLSESFDDDASDDDENAVDKPPIVEELCACIKKAEQKSTCEQGSSSAVPSPLPLSMPSSLPPPPSSLLPSPPQHTHTPDTSQIQPGTMTQSPVVPDPINSHFSQMQASHIPQSSNYLPSNSLSSSLVNTQLPSQIASVKLSSQPQHIPHVSSANVGYYTQPHSVGYSGNHVAQQPPPFVQPVVSTTQATGIPFFHSYPCSQPYHALQQAISYPISRVQRPSFPFLLNDDPQEFAMLQLALTNLLSPHESEHYKYHILLDHLRFPLARNLALAYANDPRPYSMALFALQQKYGQPHQLVLREIKAILALPKVRPGDSRAFSSFALKVRALVGMLQSLGQDQAKSELTCASHVQQLLSKLPTEHVTNFARYARASLSGQSYNLVNFSVWLQEEAECQAMADQVSDFPKPLLNKPQSKIHPHTRTVLYGANAPHFGGSWEREIRSIKTALRVVLGSQTVSEVVLRTVLTEVEGVLNSKPLGYTSSNVTDLDPITPNLLLMGRRDSSLPQVIYANTELLGRRSWRHSQFLADQFWTSFIRHYLPGSLKKNALTNQITRKDAEKAVSKWLIGARDRGGYRNARARAGEQNGATGRVTED